MTRILEMRGIVKRYGAVAANDGIDLDVEAGQIVGLLGENGSGKSTLMKVLFGMVEADAGTMVYKGRELSGHDPKQAIALGIGMIHQHFMLVEAMTVAENVMLGWGEAGAWLKRREIEQRIRATSAHFGLDVRQGDVIGELSLGERQRVEILKAVLRGVDLLVLDEPTSNLTPVEVGGLFQVLRKLEAEAKGIIFISHKLHEVLEITEAVVVLRDGRVAGRRTTRDCTPHDLARMMVERDIAAPLPRRVAAQGETPILSVRGLCVSDAAPDGLEGVDLELRPGEVVAVAGIDGNGQSALVEVLAGLRRASAGSIRLGAVDITTASAARRVAAGLSYIPADRAMTSLVQPMSVAENLGLRDTWRRPYSRAAWLDRAGTMAAARRLIADFSIRTAGPQAAARDLSGGNQQKIVVAREIDRQPRVLVAFQATWGLDPGATRFVQERIMALRNAGSAILYVSSELDEVLTLGDRIAVLCGGRLVGLMPRAEVDVNAIGLMMAGQPVPEAAGTVM